MRAILKFGTLTQEISVPDARPTVSILKPEPLNLSYRPTEGQDLTELATKRLEFSLINSPVVGEPLIYEFSGEY